MASQIRGNCQCCGADQAVLAGHGTMAKHGYTRENGWFEGVCSGWQFEPMQTRRDITDQLIVTIRKQAADLDARADQFERGEILPETVTRGWGRYEAKIPYAEAKPWEQTQAVKHALWGCRNRARAGRQMAADLERLVNALHGTPLREVEVTKPEPIRIGDVKTLGSGEKATVTLLKRGRVYWVRADGRKGWTGMAAWRKLA